MGTMPVMYLSPPEPCPADLVTSPSPPPVYWSIRVRSSSSSSSGDVYFLEKSPPLPSLKLLFSPEVKSDIFLKNTIIIGKKINDFRGGNVTRVKKEFK